MKIVVISFEKGSKSPFENIINEYKKRMSSRLSIEEKFLRVKNNKIFPCIESVLQSYKNPFVCVLDEKGSTFSTSDFVELLLKIELSGKTAVFLIGPDIGFKQPLSIKVDLLLSFSKMTFSHQIARLLLFEQFYRTYCSICNHPYNK